MKTLLTQNHSQHPLKVTLTKFLPLVQRVLDIKFQEKLLESAQKEDDALPLEDDAAC